MQMTFQIQYQKSENLQEKFNKNIKLYTKNKTATNKNKKKIPICYLHKCNGKIEETSASSCILLYVYFLCIEDSSSMSVQNYV